MKRMLFNATHPEELRVAIVDGQELLDLDIEATVNNQRKGNIYKGRVTRVEPSLEAAFVDYGAERQGFLPLKEISRVHFRNYDSSTPISSVQIKDVIEVGQELVVQVEKDERGNKGAALSTFVSLAGRFLVLMPDNPKGGGISRRISGEERQELRDLLSELEIPKGHALIARTAGIGRSPEELKWDLEFLIKIWDAIDSAATNRPAPFLIYQENNLVIRALRDYLNPNISEIVIDDEEIFERATRFMQMIMPHNTGKLKRYTDTIPLFSRYQIEHQIEAAFARHVTMSSGAQLVIDHTEAVVTIDVNSAKATSGADIEETALKTNLEAVDEIARQLRIRDIGGLIVIDLIDMLKTANQRNVERRLHEALKVDRARIQVGRISRFGLLEMSRQRLRSAIAEANYIKCPRCEGNGMIRSVPSSALSILRVIEEEALKENTEAVHAQLPLETATYLLNEKRHEVSLIEKRLATRIVLIPSTAMQSPNYDIKRLRAEEISRDKLDRPSYQLKTDDAEDDSNAYVNYQQHAQQISANKPEASISINDFSNAAPPPARPVRQPEIAQVAEVKKGLLDKIKSLFAAEAESMARPEPEQPAEKPEPAKPRQSRPRSGSSNARRSGGNRNQSSGNRRNTSGRKPQRTSSNRGGGKQAASTDNREAGGDKQQGNSGKQQDNAGTRQGNEKRPAKAGNRRSRPPRRNTNRDAQKPASSASDTAQ